MTRSAPRNHCAKHKSWRAWVFAGGIAHDFNNLLTGVVGNASYWRDEFPPIRSQSQTVQDLIEAADRMARLTSQMLAYSGRGHFVIEAVDLSKQVIRITNLIQASISKNVELRMTLASGLPLIDADVSQLQQIVMNLVINGAEAVGSPVARWRSRPAWKPSARMNFSRTSAR